MTTLKSVAGALLIIALSGFAPGVTNKSVSLSDSRINQAIQFSKENKLDEQYAIFVDFSIASGKKRLFVVDLGLRKTIFSSLCCHGLGGGSGPEKPAYSNASGSYCSSLGKYHTGKRAYSKWGIHVHYKLHGYEATNNNAYNRVVVLHSYDPVPEQEIYPQSLPLGWSLGCPVISNGCMRSIDSLLVKRQKELLLWIYN